MRRFSFADLLGRDLLSVAYVPLGFYYNLSTDRPLTLAAYAGEIAVPQQGHFSGLLETESPAVLRVGEDIRITADRFQHSPFVIEATETGRYPYTLIVNMRNGIPNVRLKMDSTDVIWLPPQRSAESVHKEIMDSQANVLRVGPLRIEDYEQEWGGLNVGRSVDHRPLRIGGQEFSIGIGTHAPSTIRGYVDKTSATLSGRCGIDDEAGDAGSVIFRITTGSHILFETGVIRGSDPPQTFSIPITGFREIEFVTDPTADGKDSDHADWVDFQVD